MCAGQPELLVTENETNSARLFGGRNRSPYVKDAFHEYLIHGNKAAVNPDQMGTKIAAFYPLQLDPGESVTIKLRLTDLEPIEGMESGDVQTGGFDLPARPPHAYRVHGSHVFCLDS